MNTERKDILKLCGLYLDKLYKSKRGFDFDNFQMQNSQKLDLPRYIILYYFKKIIASQLGLKVKDCSVGEFEKNIIDINNEIENYLIKKYRKNKLVENVKNIPINSKNIELLIPKNKKSIFNKFTKNTQRLCLEDAENIIFKDKNYFRRYIELNVDKNLEEFDLISKLPLNILVGNLKTLLNSLKSNTIEELNQKSNKSNTENMLEKTKDLNLFMERYIKEHFDMELEKYILNEKIKLIELEIEKSQFLNIEELNALIKSKQDTLEIIEDLMCDLVFDDYRFKDKIDSLIEKNIYKIYEKLPYSLELEQVIDLIGEDLFVDLIYNTINTVYQEIK
ncbi:MAG: hypothetical protein ACI3VR_02075 [Intestinibacter sp.]|uniref:hypothetical protein n=1 Tax=Intestinibacter sp. TaxID=1965304 RepID=UPI003F16510C